MGEFKYACGGCGEVFIEKWDEDWTPEKRDAEARENFGPAVFEERAELCHQCYLEFKAWLDEKIAKGELIGDPLLDRKRLEEME